ncbi:MAG: bifunctional hydroxymethylpyrimidine kinase/phosphomethylpyrimidine kinase [Nitrospirota bacterium]|nr:bifunctional hydroxymethylpyrimidine kinase/phosphomethylpyrimidine kinase [Nitrospirota bacterium]
MSSTMTPPPNALSIAGSDPSGGAGIQADIAVFTRLGVHAMAIPVALTVQNSGGVRRAEALAPEWLREQLAALLADMPPAATKTGMLGSRATVEALADALAKTPLRNLVVDPIRRASSGADLLPDDAFELLAKRLFPHALLITPNRVEAEQLWGHPVPTAREAARCAADLLQTGVRAVLLTGGHLDDRGYIVDTLADAEGITTWRHPRHPGPTPHGTGCALAAAITAHLAHGLPLRESVRRALVYMLEAIRSATTPGHGRPYLGDGSRTRSDNPTNDFAEGH